MLATNLVADDSWRKKRLGYSFSDRAAFDGGQTCRSYFFSLVPFREQAVLLCVNQAGDETPEGTGGGCQFTGAPIPRSIDFLEPPLQHFAHEIQAKLLR